jgi:hypothetical protein
MHYNERTKCIFCNNINVTSIFEKDYTVALGCYTINNKNHNAKYMPFNILKCEKCKTYQTKYLGDLNIIYDYYAKPYGSIRNEMYELFTNFILDNNNIKNICEIGGGDGNLSKLILSKKSINYTIIDPNYSGSDDNVNIINDFFENVEINDCDTLIMSHIFEHFYEPMVIIEKIAKIKNLKYIYINHPDFENYVKDNSYLILNPEHTFYIENQFLESLFLKYGFIKRKQNNNQKFAIFFKFERYTNDITNKIIPINKSSDIDIIEFYKNISKRVNYINEEMQKYYDLNIPIYIWPCSMHTVYLIMFGLKKSLLIGILDNSEHKIGKYLYGENLKCFSFKEIIKTNEKIVVILNGGTYNKEIITNNNNIIFI